MAKLDEYRQYIQQILTKYASYKPAYGDIEVETIFDTVRDHYQIVHVGWDNKNRVYGCSMHIDIKTHLPHPQVSQAEITDKKK